MHYTYKLKYPFRTPKGILVEEITLRRFTLNDMINAQEVAGSENEAKLNRCLYASACNMNPADFGYIELSEDFPDLVDGYEASLGKSNSTSQMTSEKP